MKPASTQKPTTKDDFFGRLAPKPTPRPAPRPTPSVTRPSPTQRVRFMIVCQYIVTEQRVFINNFIKNSNAHQTQTQKAITVKPNESANKSETVENRTETISVDDLTHVIKCEDLDFWDTVYSKSRLFGCYNKFVNVSSVMAAVILMFKYII